MGSIAAPGRNGGQNDVNAVALGHLDHRFHVCRRVDFVGSGRGERPTGINVISANKDVNDPGMQVNHVGLKPCQHLGTFLAADPLVYPVGMLGKLRTLAAAPDDRDAITDKDYRGSGWNCLLDMTGWNVGYATPIGAGGGYVQNSQQA